MPVVGAAAIAGAATIGGAKLASDANKRATKAQQQAASEAQKYQQGRETVNDTRYQQAWDDYQRRHAAWEARNFGPKPGAAGAGTGGRGGIMTPEQAGWGAPEVSSGQGGSIGSMMTGFRPDPMAGGFGAPVEGAQQEPQTLSDLSGWEDWKKYGLS